MANQATGKGLGFGSQFDEIVLVFSSMERCRLQDEIERAIFQGLGRCFRTEASQRAQHDHANFGEFRLDAFEGGESRRVEAFPSKVTRSADVF